MRYEETDYLAEAESVYFVGIGGIGMSALARVLKGLGLEVSGSDMHENNVTRDLRHKGINIHIGQKQPNLGNADLIVYSTAIPKEHVELQAARALGIRICHRAQILASLLNHAKTSVAVTGTHGKTTTSSMLSFILAEAGCDPTCLVGGDVLNFGVNARIGASDLWVSEVDESDKSHELYAPNYTIITNLEIEHPDHYRDYDDLIDSFRRFLGNVRNPGLLVYPLDDPILARMVRESGKPSVSFGFSEQADFSAHNIVMNAYHTEFDLYESGFFASRARLRVPGRHNVANAIAAIALLTQLGLDLEVILEAMERFKGARRRLEILWESPEVMVIDDYAHHPTEVAASIQALQALDQPLTIVFQPHRFTRVQLFRDAFAKSLMAADQVILTDVYAAGEAQPEGVCSEQILNVLSGLGHTGSRLIHREGLMAYLSGPSRPKGVVAFLGAGNIGEIAREFTEHVKVLAAK